MLWRCELRLSQISSVILFKVTICFIWAAVMAKYVSFESASSIHCVQLQPIHWDSCRGPGFAIIYRIHPSFSRFNSVSSIKELLAQKNPICGPCARYVGSTLVCRTIRQGLPPPQMTGVALTVLSVHTGETPVA